MYIQPTMDHIVLWIFTIKNKKTPHIRGPVQFECMLFKGQLYCNIYEK